MEMTATEIMDLLKARLGYFHAGSTNVVELSREEANGILEFLGGSTDLGPNSLITNPDGVWRCSACGQTNVAGSPSWRWTGKSWEHCCGPQLGYFSSTRIK
jgi:hypothetical protein